MKSSFILILFLTLISCDLVDKKLIKYELKSEISLFETNKDYYKKMIQELEYKKLLESSNTFDSLAKIDYSNDLKILTKQLKIKNIKYGRILTCDAMINDNRELFFQLNDKINIWYCPCIKQSEKGYFQNNKRLRGYKGKSKFKSLGLGRNWAITKTN